MKYTDDLINVANEISYLESILPAKVDEETLRQFITKNCTDMQIGQAMGMLKKEFGASVDMKVASEILKGK